MKLQHTRTTDKSMFYEGYFAGNEIEVEIGIGSNMETRITASGHHISTVPTHEISESEHSLSDYVEYILIDANVGR